jgi:hypothetical protein
MIFKVLREIAAAPQETDTYRCLRDDHLICVLAPRSVGGC